MGRGGRNDQSKLVAYGVSVKQQVEQDIFYSACGDCMWTGDLWSLVFLDAA